MGHDQRQPSSSAGAIVAVIAAVLVIGLLALVAVGGVAYFWLQSSAQRSQAMVAEQRAIAELHRAEAENNFQKAEAMAQADQKASAAAEMPNPRLTFHVTVDAEGNVSVDGEQIGLDELTDRLTNRQRETQNAFRVQIQADAQCPIKHLIPVLDACEEAGDIDFRVATNRYDSSEAEKHSQERACPARPAQHNKSNSDDN